MKLLTLVILLLATWSSAQVLNLYQGTDIIGLGPLPCLGLATDCLAHSNASLDNSSPAAIWDESEINPGAGVQYVRVSDQNTMGASTPVNSFVATASGGSYDNMFSKLVDRFTIANATTGQCITYIFNPVNFTSGPFTKMYGPSYSVGCNNTWFWSYTQPYIAYTVAQLGQPPKILYYDYTSTTVQPTVQVLVDLSVVPNCLPPGFVIMSSGVLTVSKDDQTFSIAVGSTSNRQYEVVWNRTMGCRVFDVQADRVVGSWGPTGAITVPGGATFYIHQTYLSQNGDPSTTNVMIGAEPGTCVPSVACLTQGNGRWVWQVNTLTVGALVNSNDGGGHIIQGFNNWANQSDTGNQPDPEFFMRNFNEPNPSPNAVELIYSPPPSWTLMDSHSTWHNDIDDTQPFFSGTFNTQAGANNMISHYLEAEIIAVPTACYVKDVLDSCSGSLPYRIGHTRSDITTQSTNFEDSLGIGTISANPSNGYYYFSLSTNWISGFGCTDGTYAPCSVGAIPRADVVVVRIPSNSGSQVTISPTSLTFGSQIVGTSSASQPVTLTNSGTGSVTGIRVSTSGDFTENDNCGTTLSGNSTCTINVTFTPSVVGTRTGTLTVTDSAGTQTTSLSGTGVSAVSLTPSTVNFGNQPYGVASSPQLVTLANSQTSALTGISVSITGTNAADFAQTNDCGMSLAGDSSCAINVTFTPSIYGAESATLSVTDSAGTQTSSLTGTGTDVTAPTTRITAPANNATVSGTVTVTAAATDNLGITSIQIYIDGALKASGTSSPLNYLWHTTAANNGSHTIYSKAYDAAGNVGTSGTITVTVNNRGVGAR